MKALSQSILSLVIISHTELRNLKKNLKILFIDSSETHRERQRHRQREKQAPPGEPEVGRILASRDHALALAEGNPQPLSQPGDRSNLNV